MIQIADQSFEKFEDAFAWCKENGSATDWDVLGVCYYNAHYYLNALQCFKQADEIRLQALSNVLDIGSLEFSRQYWGNWVYPPETP